MGSERYRVGYALEAKKVKTFMLPSLIEQAEAKGLVFVPVDPARPLSEQGPFHCIIHKLYDPNWAHELLRFPGPVIDPPDRIELLHSRTTMLEAVSRLKIPSFNVTVPEQRVVTVDSGLDLDGLIRFPVIAKPVSADGGAGSHDMMLISTPDALRRIAADATWIKTQPIVVQEFVNHGGVVFKVYVIGSHVKCVRRASLPDISPDFFALENSDVVPFSRVSNSVAESTDDSVVTDLPAELAEKLAGALRAELRLSLFNFDVIKKSNENGDGDKYYVIDINYFPGFAKMPDFERVFTGFLLEVVHG